MPSLGLAMIVKNGAKRLPDCIASVAGVVDQIVIADTGSTDGSPETARALGAEVFDYPWQDDFSQARNAAIRALSTDWVLVIDDDEELEPRAGEKIRLALDRAGVGGYFVTQRNFIPVSFGSGGYASSVKPNDTAVPRTERARAYADFATCRIFRRQPGIHYAGRVHEQVVPQIRACGLELASLDLVVHHFGHLSGPAKLKAKDDFYRKLGQLKLKDAPNDPQTWIELGLQEYEQFKNYSAGIECFKKALALDPRHSTVPYLSLANLYLDIQADDRALALLSTVTMKGRDAGVKEHICADAFYNLGRLKQARSAYMRALRILPDDSRIASKLGLTEVRLGLKTSGLSHLARALKASPEVCEMHDRLVKAYILMNLLPQAAEAAERMAVEFPAPATILRAASIRAQMQQWEQTVEIIVRGLRQFPQSQELLQARSELQQETARAIKSPALARPDELLQTGLSGR